MEHLPILPLPRRRCIGGEQKTSQATSRLSLLSSRETPSQEDGFFTLQSKTREHTNKTRDIQEA